MTRVLLTLLAALALQTSDTEFESELAPGGSRLLYKWETPTPQLRREPHWTSPVVKTLDGVRGRRVEYDSIRYRTTVPGIFVALRDGNLMGRDFGETRAVPFAAYYGREYSTVVRSVATGDTVSYLQYRAEGTCFLRHGSTVIEAKPCPIELPADWKTVRDAKTELWIRVTTLGAPLGWILAGPRITKVED